jgi:hypothetical protein
MLDGTRDVSVNVGAIVRARLHVNDFTALEEKAAHRAAGGPGPRLGDRATAKCWTARGMYPAEPAQLARL